MRRFSLGRFHTGIIYYFSPHALKSTVSLCYASISYENMAVNLEISARLTRFNPSVKQTCGNHDQGRQRPRRCCDKPLSPQPSGWGTNTVLKLGEMKITECAQFSGLAARQEDLDEFFKVLDSGLTRRLTHQTVSSTTSPQQ